MKKVWNRGGVDNQKHSTLNLNGIDYNIIENEYVFSNLSWAPITKNIKEIEQKNSAVADSGCMGNFVAVYSHLNNVRHTMKIIN